MTAQPYKDPRLAGVYERGNAMPGSSLRVWAGLIASFGPDDRSATLDVGTGTGMFAAALAESMPSGFTLGVDPSPGMLVEAQRLHSHPRVKYLAGDAAALPIASECFDLALLSRVIHHLRDRRHCAMELRRVLRRSGVVVVRTTVRERLDALVYDYWPRLRELDQARFPSVDMIVADFEAAGFTTSTVDATDEFAAGLARLRQDAREEADQNVISERYDVLVFAAR